MPLLLRQDSTDRVMWNPIFVFTLWKKYQNLFPGGKTQTPFDSIVIIVWYNDFPELWALYKELPVIRLLDDGEFSYQSALYIIISH